MRFIASIFLALLVFIQTPLGQLFKLPVLVEHFSKHQDRDGTSLLAFLEEHYSPGHNDSDLPEDKELPFKTINFNTIGTAIVPGSIKASAYVPETSNTKVSFRHAYAPQQHLCNIFHPPRA